MHGAFLRRSDDEGIARAISTLKHDTNVIEGRYDEYAASDKTKGWLDQTFKRWVETLVEETAVKQIRLCGQEDVADKYSRLHAFFQEYVGAVEDAGTLFAEGTLSRAKAYITLLNLAPGMETRCLI